MELHLLCIARATSYEKLAINRDSVVQNVFIFKILDFY